MKTLVMNRTGNECSPLPAKTEASPTASAGRAAASMRPPRLLLLDGLRFIAAIMVVLYHYTAWHQTFWHGTVARDAWPTLSRITVFGNMGVQLFFIISGFVILLSAYGKSIPQYVGSRIGRLFPAYWVAVIAAGVLVLFIWPAMGEGRTVADWAINLTMVQQGLDVPHMDGVYWTLWTELRFYLWILLLMLLRCLTPQRILAFAALWPVAVIATSGVDASWREQLLIPDHAALFAGGMVLFLIYRFGHTLSRWAVLGFTVVCAALQTGVGAPAEAANLVGYQIPAWTYWVIVVGLFALVGVIALTRLGRVSLPGLALAGALTYPVYLLHEVWGWWLIKLLSPRLNPIVVLLLVIAMVAAAAYLVHRAVEQRWGRSLSKAVTAGLEAADRALRRLWHSAGSRGLDHLEWLANVGQNGTKPGDELIGSDERRIPVFTGAQGNSAATDRDVGIDRPGGTRTQWRDRSPLVSGGTERNIGAGQ